MTDRLKGMMVGLALLALPFIMEPGLSDATRIPKIKLVSLLGGLFAAYWVGRNMRLSLGLAVGGFSTLVVLHGYNSLHIFQLIFFAGAVVFASLCVDLSERSMNRVLDCLAVSGVMCAVYGYFQMFGIDPVFFLKAWAPETAPSAMLGQHTLLGSYLACTTTAAMFRHRHSLAAVQAPVVFATESSFAVVSLLLGVLLWAYYSQGWRVAFSLGAALAGALLILYVGMGKKHYFDSTGRMAAWSVAVDKIKQKPLTGWGPGMFKAFYPNVQPKFHQKMHGEYRQAHNDYLQLAYEYGAVGVLCGILLIWDFLRQAWRKRNITSVAALSSIVLVFLVNAIGSFPFHLVPHGLVALCAWTAVTTHRARPLEGI